MATTSPARWSGPPAGAARRLRARSIPCLREFEAGGFVTATEEVVGGRQRRTYELTEAGRAAFRVALDAWMEATAALQDTGRAFAAADRAREARASKGECCR
jgi:DNA-binding PadR family transcriptional regulator